MTKNWVETKQNFREKGFFRQNRLWVPRKPYKMTRNSATILKVRINSSSTSSLLREILGFVAKPASGKVVFTPNPEFLVAASKDKSFRQILNQADINLPDGWGLIWLSRLVGQPIKERISGADLVARLLAEGNQKGWQVGIAGARRGLPEESMELVERLRSRYPNLKIYHLDNFKFQISNFKFDLVLACQGMGKQERWIMENKNKIQAAVFLGVGGSLDFLTGFTRRAPRWMQAVGLEWLWRALQSPAHWKRIWKAVVVFPLLVIKEKVLSIKYQVSRKNPPKP